MAITLVGEHDVDLVHAIEARINTKLLEYSDIQVCPLTVVLCAAHLLVVACHAGLALTCCTGVSLGKGGGNPPVDEQDQHGAASR